MSITEDELEKLRKELSDLEKQEEEAKKKCEEAKLRKEQKLKEKIEAEKERDLLLKMKEEQEKENARLQEAQQKKISENNSTSQNKFLQDSIIQILSSNETDSLTNKILIGRGPEAWTFRAALKLSLAYKEIEFLQPNKDNSESLHRLEQELDILNKLNHPNILKTYGINTKDFNKPTIICEYCPYNLLGLIVKLKSSERVTVLYEICLALNEIHKANLIHLNLKPENILLTEEKHVKISDTGFSKIEETKIDMLGLSTLRFTAPELLNDNDKKVSQKVDVFSFSFVAFFVLTKGKYPRLTIDDVLDKKKVEIPESINKTSKELIERCMAENPDDRMSFGEIIEYIKNNNFKLIDGIDGEIDQIKKFLSI